MEIQNRNRGMVYEDMESFYKGIRRFDAPFRWQDAVKDAFMTGHGPIAPLLGSGLIYKLYMKIIGKAKQRKERMKEKEKLLEAPDEGVADDKQNEDKAKENGQDADAEKMAIKKKKSYVVRMEEGDLRPISR